jgi:anthranilate synthase/aminodeoxychorismate synthase-like glutamine amidotransferase
VRVLVIDNYDSFVYNLAQYLGSLGAEPLVMRNDVPLDEMRAAHADALVVSPGPGRPEDAGNSIEAIKSLGEEMPVLGVCLGHQAIGAAYGGLIIRAEKLMHGKTSLVFHESQGVLAGLPNPFEAVRYHSLVIDNEAVPDQLEVTAATSDKVVMAVRHRELPIEGVQFHPEAVLTERGLKLIENFLESVPVISRR